MTVSVSEEVVAALLLCPVLQSALALLLYHCVSVQGEARWNGCRVQKVLQCESCDLARVVAFV